MIKDELLRAALLRYSTSTHSSQFILVKKPGKAYWPEKRLNYLTASKLRKIFLTK